MLPSLKLLQQLATLDIHLYPNGDKLKVRDAHKRLTDELREQIKAQKVALLDLLDAGQQPAVETVYALTPLQAGMLFQSQLHTQSGAYIEHSHVHVQDVAFDAARFRDAMQQVIDHYASLRAAFYFEQGSEPLQVIYTSVSLPVTVLDWQTLSAQAYSDHLAKLSEADRRKDFAFTQAPLLRLLIVVGAHHRYDLILTYHHILLDGWSVDLFWTAVWRAYKGLALPQAAPYGAYLHYLHQQPVDAAFWQRYLHGFYAPTPLPAAHTATQGEGQTASLTQSFTLAATQQLSAFARRQGVTLNNLFQAAWAMLLARYSREMDIVFGVVTSGRTAPIPAIETMIGLLVNILPFRVQLESGSTTLSLLAQVVQTQLELQQREHASFVDVQRWSEMPAGVQLFETLLLFQNIPQTAEQPFGASKPQSDRVESIDPGYPLLAIVTPGSTIEPTTLKICYHTARYAAETVARILAHWQQLLMGMVAYPAQTVMTLPMLTEQEYQQIVYQWNNIAITYPTGKTIHKLFEEQVERTPEAVAVVMDDSGQPPVTLTYRELNERANQLAHYLQTLGVRPNALVGICVERSLAMVVGLLGILKAGGAYVPFDPSYPQDRLAFMLQDSQVTVLLTQPALLAKLPVSQAQVVCWEADAAPFANLPTDNPQSPVGVDNLAYVIYTSGSTGQPKGTLISHHNVVRLFAATAAWFHFSEQDVWTLFHSYAFDFSVWEMWGALLYGGRLVVIPYLVSRSPEEFYVLLVRQQVTVLNQTPSAFRQLMAAEARRGVDPDLALRLVIFGGEALEIPSLRPWFERHGEHRPRLVNMYGITETTVHVTYRPIQESDLQSPASVIGVPIPDLAIYLLDEQQQPVPIGVAAEIYVGGAGVSQGYLHRPALTAARFIPNPYGAGQLYRTGDLARWRPDGSLEYLGRIDHQVKLRGFRIELGEIEGVLSQHPAVQEVVVSVREDGNPLGAGEQRLVAYVVQAATRDLHPAELRRYVQSKLPEYMLPSDFVVLAALPLTANGKVDRKALPMPNRQADRIRVTRPRTWTEQQLVQIWEKLLAIHPVGVEDHFFELGGHSLLAVQLLTRIQQTFGQTLPLRTLFAHPTIAELALALHQDTSALTASTLVAFQPQGAQPPLYCLPGVGGGVLHFYPLAQAWGKQQPLYALESVGLDGKTTPFATVEAAATYQVQQLQRHQPQGPYYLAGHSYGGFVAFAMAQQLLKAGAEIGALCLLDTEAPTGKVTALDEVSIILLYERLFLEEYALSPTLSAAQLLPLTSEARLLAFKAALEAAKVLPLHSALDLVRGIVNVITADLQATAYLPTHSVRLPIHLFVATEDKQNPEVAQAMLVGWAKYGDVTVHEVPGAHMTMLYPPHVQTLASELAAVLASVTGDGI